MKKKFKIKVVHIKGGLWGGVVGTFFVLLSGLLPPIMILIGGFFGVFIVRKQIKLTYPEGLKIGLISGAVASLYTLILYYRAGYTTYLVTINAITVFLFMIAGTFMALMIYRPRTKKMH